MSSNGKKKLQRASYVKVHDLLPETHGHNLVVLVHSVDVPVEKTKYNGSVSKIAEAVVGDETGCVTFTARNDQIELFQAGNVLVIRNSNIDMFNGFMRLSVTQWGKVSPHPDGVESTPGAPTTCNLENNLSSVEYELVTVGDY